MDPRPLRNDVERFAGMLRRDAKTEDDMVVAGLAQALGMTLVGIYEELAGIRKAFEGSNE